MKKFIPLLAGVLILNTTVACSKPSDKVTTTNASNVTNQQAVVPAGTTVDSVLQQDLSTGKNQNNEQFTLKVKGQNPTLKDAVIQGHLEDVVKAARGKKASLHLVIDEIVLKSGTAYPFDATLVNTQLETKTKGKFVQNAGIILGGTVAGHFLGKKTKVKHGALTGAAAATAFVLSSPGGEVVLKKGTVVKLKLKTPLETAS